MLYASIARLIIYKQYFVNVTLIEINIYVIYRNVILIVQIGEIFRAFEEEKAKQQDYQ